MGGGRASYHGVSAFPKTENRRAAAIAATAATAEILPRRRDFVICCETAGEGVRPEETVREMRKIANEIRRRKMLFA